MKKICIHDFIVDGLQFCKGCEYKIEYNQYDNNIYIYNCFGYTIISKSILNNYFL